MGALGFLVLGRASHLSMPPCVSIFLAIRHSPWECSLFATPVIPRVWVSCGVLAVEFGMFRWLSWWLFSVIADMTAEKASCAGEVKWASRELE